MSEISFMVHRTLSRQYYGREVVYVERYFRYGNFGSHHIIQKIVNVTLHEPVTSIFILLGLSSTCSLTLNQNVLGDLESASCD